MRFMKVEVPVVCDNCPFKHMHSYGEETPFTIGYKCGLVHKPLKNSKGPRLKECPRVLMPIVVVPPGMFKDIKLVKEEKEDE